LKKKLLVYLGKFEIIRNQRRFDVYAVRSEHTIKSDTIESHEIPLSRMLAKFYRFADAIRGPYGVDQETLPDREMVMGGVLYKWEFFTGKQSRGQLSGRLKKHEGKGDTILAVCLTARYAATVREVAECVRDEIYFSTYEEVLRDPFGKVWRDYDGERAGVQLPVAHPGADGGG
jgi:hypothetical protein